MTVLRIEHPVHDFDAWKRAFDSDPASRQRSGVRRYRIMRGIDDPDLVSIDLELGSVADAEALLDSLRVIWARVQGSLIGEPAARIVETVESVDY